MKDKIFYGVVVFYNPIIDETLDNISSYIEELKKLYIIDNSENSNFNILKKYIKVNKSIEYIWLRENKGIARALNIAKNKAIKENADYLLTMDQDSKFKNGFFEMKKYILENQDSLEEVGIISPIHNLNNNKYTNKNLSIQEKDKVMTSGNVLNLKVLKNIGDFNEEFFIDEVDHEFCYRVKENGYKVVCLSGIILNHKLGNLKNYYFFSVTNHNYIRRYYITRNKLYMMLRFNNLKKKYLLSLISDFFKIIFFENDKKKKIKYFSLGVKDFYNKKNGKLNR